MGWLLLNSEWDVSSDLDYGWNILEDVTGNKSFSWDILENVSGALDLSWNIWGFVAGALAYSWMVLADTNEALPYSWDINVFFGSSKPQFRFNAQAEETEFQSGNAGYLSNEFKKARMR